ncbi:MAG: hypothetical protein NTX11_02770 [Candidatus Saccharibacteria bacterium]|nr:hypothetical protein [Candidatus Saccharibacteria bacterium]
MKDGLDLLDEDIFEMQLVDVMSTIEKLKIKDSDDHIFVLTIITRLNADKAIEIS